MKKFDDLYSESNLIYTEMEHSQPNQESLGRKNNKRKLEYHEDQNQKRVGHSVNVTKVNDYETK